MSIEIRNRFNGNLIKTVEARSLTEANLARAALIRADLTGADLTGANLRGANLTEAKNLELARGLDIYRLDIWRVLWAAPHEAQFLLDSLRAGKIDGSKYEGECCGLKGTLAKGMHCHYSAIRGLVADESEPSEKWFLPIRPGDTPDNYAVVALTVKWIEEWLAQERTTKEVLHEIS